MSNERIEERARQSSAFIKIYKFVFTGNIKPVGVERDLFSFLNSRDPTFRDIKRLSSPRAIKCLPGDKFDEFAVAMNIPSWKTFLLATRLRGKTGGG